MSVRWGFSLEESPEGGVVLEFIAVIKVRVVDVILHCWNVGTLERLCRDSMLVYGEGP